MMRFNTILAVSMALARAQALPSPASSGELTTIIDDTGVNWVGDNEAIVTKRGLDAQCSCWPACFPEGHSCIPGWCQCAGDNGCWSYGGEPFKCQKGP